MQDLALYIDIEGFGKKFEDGGKKSFIDLTNDLYALGQSHFSHLAIIQFGGDGFLIYEILKRKNNITEFIDFSAALLQMITIRGGAGRVQISHGYMSDISGLYSEEIQKEIRLNHQNILGGTKNNIMLINSVIGTSIINCYKLQGPKGPLLLVDIALKEMIEKQKILYEIFRTEKYEVLNVNWLKHNNENSKQILKLVNLNNSNLKKEFLNYINNNKLDCEWRKYALKLVQ